VCSKLLAVPIPTDRSERRANDHMVSHMSSDAPLEIRRISREAGCAGDVIDLLFVGA
jgi:hypothetical protein